MQRFASAIELPEQALQWALIACNGVIALYSFDASYLISNYAGRQVAPFSFDNFIGNIWYWGSRVIRQDCSRFYAAAGYKQVAEDCIME